jgi:uncharacterized membrane protein YbhN (UPF0104 family)
MRRLGRVLAVIAVAAACVLLFRRLDPARVGAALASASWSLVALAAALNLLQVGLRSLLLQAMLAPLRAVAVARLCRYNLAMFAANNLLPARAGELVRIHLLRARESVPAEAGLAVALVEKLLDAVALLLIALPLPLLLPALPRPVSFTTLACGVGGLVGLGAAWWVARSADGEGGRWARFAHGAAVVGRPRAFAAALGWSLASHLLDGVAIAVCLAALHLRLAPAAPLVVLLAVTMVLALPSLPGGVGALEVGAVVALRLLGVEPERALAFALVYHAMQVVPVTLLGLDGMRLAATAR